MAKKKPLTIEAAVQEWAQDTRLRPRTFESYASIFRVIVRSGLKTVESLTRKNVRACLVAQRKRGITGSTCNHYLAAVQSLIAWLESRGRVPMKTVLELRGLRFEVGELPPPRYLSPEEYGRLLAAARAFRPTMGWAVALAVNTGLRLGELRQLHHEELVLDVEEPFVRVLRSSGRQTKTNRERGVPISRSFAEELRKAGFGTPKTGPVFPANVARPGGPRKGKASSQPYLATPTLERWMQTARAAAGLGPEVNWITCRHTFCSWLWAKGISPGLIATYAGHSVAVGQKHYIGCAPAGNARVAEGFAEVEQGERVAREAAAATGNGPPTLAADLASLASALVALRPLLDQIHEKADVRTTPSVATKTSPSPSKLPERVRARFRRSAPSKELAK